MKWAITGAVLLGTVFLTACSGGQSKPNVPATGTPAKVEATTSPVACPVDADLCQFAGTIETAARDGTLALQFGGANQTAFRAVTLAQAQWESTDELPRLTTIGCPLAGNEASCSKFFALALSSLPDGVEGRDGRGLVILFFERSPSGNDSAAIVADSEPQDRRSIVVAGGDRTFCELSVSLPDCSDYRFVKYRTGVAEPSPAATTGTLPPIRESPGATSFEMALSRPYSVQSGEVWYFSYLCDACGPGPFPNLYRAYRDAGGALVIDDLKAKAADLGQPVNFTADWKSGTAYLATCRPGVNCYSLEEGNAESTSPVVVYKSTDGAVTWHEDGTVPPLTSLKAFGSQEALAVTYAEGFSSPRYWFYPSGRDFEPPAQVAGPLWPVVLSGLTIVWRNQAGEYFDQAGTKLFGPVFDGFGIQLVAADPQYQHTYVSWSEPGGSQSWLQQPWFTYVGRIDRDGQMREIYGLPGDTLWIGGEFPRNGDEPPALFGRFRFGTSLDYVRDVSFGGVLDLTNGEVHRFAEFDSARPPGNFTWMQGLITTPIDEVTGSRTPFYRVIGAGDCLNVRDRPSLSGAVLACLPDDVLVGGLAQVQTADGIKWQLIQTPGHQIGWASAEFLK